MIGESERESIFFKVCGPKHSTYLVGFACILKMASDLLLRYHLLVDAKFDLLTLNKTLRYFTSNEP